MKKMSELFFSLLAFYLFSCLFGAVVIIGLLLIPFAMVTLCVIAIKEIIYWSRKPKTMAGPVTMSVHSKEAAVIRPMPLSPRRKAA